jgi:hypothetical protein
MLLLLLLLLPAAAAEKEEMLVPNWHTFLRRNLQLTNQL